MFARNLWSDRIPLQYASSKVPSVLVLQNVASVISLQKLLPGASIILFFLAECVTVYYLTVLMASNKKDP